MARVGSRGITSRACEYCRRAKRKCSGTNPCERCSAFGKRCYFSSLQAASNSPLPVAGSKSLPQEAGPDLHESKVAAKAVEAASGLLSFKNFAKQADPGNVYSIQARAWNMGFVRTNNLTFPPMSTCIDYENGKVLSNFFFETVHPIYCCVDARNFYLELQKSYTSFETTRDSFQPVLCGVIALGSLFSRRNAQVLPLYNRKIIESSLMERAEIQLMKAAKIADRSSSSEKLHYTLGLLLRTIYLRASDSPSVAWMSCCSTAHLAEIFGVQDESKWEIEEEKQISRRLYWCIDVLNSWISLEIGRTKVGMAYTDSKIPTNILGPNDHLCELIQFHRSTSNAFMPKSQVDELLNGLNFVINFVPPHEELSLERSYAAVVIFRRLRLANVTLSDSTASSIITTAADGLAACRNFARVGQPWWHVANLPFQLLCLLLILDSKESLSRINETLDAIVFVANQFRTEEMFETVRTAQTLIEIIRQGKMSELFDLEDSLARLKSTAGYEPHAYLQSSAADKSETVENLINDFFSF